MQRNADAATRSFRHPLPEVHVWLLWGPAAQAGQIIVGSYAAGGQVSSHLLVEAGAAVQPRRLMVRLMLLVEVVVSYLYRVDGRKFDQWR